MYTRNQTVFYLNIRTILLSEHFLSSEMSMAF